MLGHNQILISCSRKYIKKDKTTVLNKQTKTTKAMQEIAQEATDCIKPDLKKKSYQGK